MNILIVEDEPEIAKLIQLALEAEGFSCYSCRNGLTALQIVALQTNINKLD